MEIVFLSFFLVLFAILWAHFGEHGWAIRWIPAAVGTLLCFFILCYLIFDQWMYDGDIEAELVKQGVPFARGYSDPGIYNVPMQKKVVMRDGQIDYEYWEILYPAEQK